LNPKSLAAVAEPHPGMLLTARNDMRPVAALLASPPDGPWCVAVAESGQKHSLPWAPVNHGQGPWAVQLDAARVPGDPATFRLALSRSAALRKAGFTAAEITALDPGGKLGSPLREKRGGETVTLMTARDRLAAWSAHSAALAPWRGSLVLFLANFMISKETLDDYLAAYPAG